jgi:hypothetical protein
MNSSKSLRWLVLLLAPIFGGACIAQTAAGPTQTPYIVVVSATGGAPVSDSSPQAPIPDATASLTAPADPTATPTVALVTMTAGQDLSCVKGPHWILYEWVTRIHEGETVTLTARSTAEWPDYYYARKEDGTECWAFGGSSAVHGDPSTLPEREAPPLPTVNLTVENKLHVSITDVFIRGQDDPGWGADRLGGSIAFGAAFELPLTAGFYDVQIKDQFGSVVFTKSDTPIGSEASSRRLTVDTVRNFYFNNLSPHNLCWIRGYPQDGSAFLEIPMPSDGVVNHGEQLYSDIPLGIYEFRFYRCGDGMVVGSIPDVYVSPTTTGVALS